MYPPNAAAQLRMGGNEGGNEGDTRGLIRPCWDCGQRTGSFCDGVGGPCLARSTCPAEEWGQRQRTPLCTACDERHHGVCHSCREVAGCRPFAWGGGLGGSPAGGYSR